MIQKTYTEGIFLEHEGPVTSRSYRSCHTSSSEQSYIAGVTLEPRLVPKRTFFVLEGVLPKSRAVYNRSCSLTDGGETYGSSVSVYQDSLDNGDGRPFACDHPYYQNIELEPRLVPQGYSETVHRFPKLQARSYLSSLVYQPDLLRESYVAGLRVDKLKEVTLQSCDSRSSFTASSHFSVDGDEQTRRKKAGVDEPDYANIVNGV